MMSENQNWQPFKVVPKSATRPDFTYNGQKPQGVWKYELPDGSESFYVCRFDQADGSKLVRPFSYGRLDDKEGWHWKAPAPGAPAFNLSEALRRITASILVVEGEKTCEAAQRLFPDYVCVTSRGGANAPHLTDWSFVKGRSVVIWPDNDEAGMKFQKSLVKIFKEHEVNSLSIVNVPTCFPNHWDLADSNPAGYSFDDLNRMLKNPQPVSNAESKSKPWPELKALPSVLSVPPDIPLDMIPDPIRNWVEDEVTRIGTRLASFVAVVIASVAIIAGLKIVICPKEFDTGWKVSLAGLWVAIVGRPASKKTPTITAASKMLHHLEKQANAKYLAEMQIKKPLIIIIEAEIEGLKKKIETGAKSGGKIKDLEQAKVQLIDALQRLKELKTPERRYTAQDVTIEQFQKLLVENPNGLGVLFDEMTAWLKGLERKGHETARSTYLKAHNGLQDERIDRVTRESVYIPRLFAVIIGGIQPDPFDKILRDAINGEGSGSDGLIQRFQLALVQSLDGASKGQDRPPKESEFLTIFQIAERLDQMDQYRSDMNRQEPLQIHFDFDAQRLFNVWYDQHYTTLQSGDHHHIVESHLSKQAATMPALALVFELLNWASGSQKCEPKNVSLESAKLAARWIDYLTEHMKCLYLPSLIPAAQGANSLVKKIRAKNLVNGFNVREIVRKKWSYLSDQNIVEQAINILEDCNYLREIPAIPPPLGRIPSPRYEINPAIFNEATNGI